MILALSRAIGETAPLLVIGAAVNPRFNPDGLGSAFTALPIQIFAWTQDPNREFVDLAAAAILVHDGRPAADELRRDLPPQPLRAEVVIDPWPRT